MADITDATPHAGADFDVPISPVVFSGMPPSRFACESEEALSRRFMRPVRKRAGITYEFTRDPALIAQYCQLYESECSPIDIARFRLEEGKYNSKSHIVVAKRGNLCIGGARLTVSTPRQPQMLPLEINGFKLEDHFPHLKSGEMRYGGLSRLVLLPEFRNGDVARLLFHSLYRKAVALSLDMVFAAASSVSVRSYRKSALAYGMKEAKIHTDVQMPPYPGFEEVKGYLLSIAIDKSLFPHDLECIEYPIDATDKIRENN